jgi:hypothetical protein
MILLKLPNWQKIAKSGHPAMDEGNGTSNERGAEKQKSTM